MTSQSSVSSAAEDSRDVLRFVVIKKDLEQSTANISVVMQRQILEIQKTHRKKDIPLLQYIDTMTA